MSRRDLSQPSFVDAFGERVWEERVSGSDRRRAGLAASGGVQDRSFAAMPVPKHATAAPRHEQKSPPALRLSQTTQSQRISPFCKALDPFDSDSASRIGRFQMSETHRQAEPDRLKFRIIHLSLSASELIFGQWGEEVVDDAAGVCPDFHGDGHARGQGDGGVVDLHRGLVERHRHLVKTKLSGWPGRRWALQATRWRSRWRWPGRVWRPARRWRKRRC